MPQDSLRSVVYRSFVTCDDPKGVAECKTTRKSKKTEQKTKKTTMSEGKDEEKQSNEELQSLSCFQMMEVSRGAERLNEVIGSLSNRPSIDAPSKSIATDLLRGALDLQESLVMLGKLQEASNYIANSTKKHREKRPVDDGCNEFKDFEKPRISADRASKDCYDELREVIRESFARQNLLSKVDRKHSDLCVDLPSSSSSHSSLIYSHSSGCSPSSIRLEKMKGPNLIAKLMGLEGVPLKAGNAAVLKQMEKERIPYRISPLLDVDLPRPKKPQFMVEKAVREKRTLEEIIETMQFKGILGRNSVDGSNECRRNHCNASCLRKNSAADGPPIVLMRPLRGCGDCDGEPHDDHWINEGELIKSRQMHRKMREEFLPRAQLKVKETNEKSTPKQKLDKRKEGKNSGKVQVRPVKKTVDSQGRLSTTKMNHSKPMVPQMQKKEAVFQKIEKIPKAAANTRKMAETKDAKPQRSDKTQDLAKLAALKHSRTVRENNVSKSQIARAKVAAADRNIPTIPKKNPRKGESKSKPSSALVENIQSDGNSAINIETNIEGSLVKITEAEQSTEEVSEASYMSENSRNAAATSTTKDDLYHIEDGHCIQSYDSDQIKGCKSITNTRYFLLGSVSFLNHVEELFDIRTHDSTDFQTARLSDGEVLLHDSLLLDCAKEILERKSLQYRRMRNSWPQSLLRRPKCHLSMEQLVEEICDGIEDLQNYSKSCGDVVLADGIYPMLERDLWWNEAVTGAWDSGWRNGYTTEAVDEVMHGVEELVLSEIVGDLIIEIMK
ncbi:hypothetical protein C2S51_000704 [Perilla frutescens var. frutescens]|nr:hypothetical protein C2S51_000704 [Perilla frutescens var. frutescens]